MRGHDASQVARRRWSRAYFTILALSLILILPSSFVLATAIDRWAHLQLGLPQVTTGLAGLLPAELPMLTRMYLWLGPWGILALGHGAALAILALCVRRTRPDATLLALALLLLALLVLWAGPALGQFPWRSSDTFQYFQF